MTSKNISGGRGADEIVRAYLARPSPSTSAVPHGSGAASAGTPSTPASSAPTSSPAATPTPATTNPSTVQSNLGFYVIGKQVLIDATTTKYRKFLKDSGYADLDAISEMHVAKNVLRYDASVRNAAATAGLSLSGRDGDYIVSINQTDGRRLIQAMGGQLLTTALMYKVFIPYIKAEVQKGNAEAQTTLNEMINAKAEWLEDIILDPTIGRILKIGNSTKRLSFPNKDGRFDRADLNEYGYPTQIKDSGEHYYWCPRQGEMAAFRGWVSELDLYLNREPGFVNDDLGVRVAKFLP